MRKLFLLSCLVLGACTNSDDANKALDDIGFTNIELTGYSWFSCSGDDTYHTGFRAINPQKKVVTGTVCSGMWFKNSTVRFN